MINVLENKKKVHEWKELGEISERCLSQIRLNLKGKPLYNRNTHVYHKYLTK